MERTYPQIDIAYNRFLAPFFDFHTKYELKKDELKWQPPEYDEVAERIDAQQRAWKPVEQDMLDGMQDALNLSFFENRIPVYIVPVRKGAFSDPIVISSHVQGDRFVDLLTHELIHRLVVYNNEQVDMRTILHELYPDVDNFLVRNHVLVHAVHAQIYQEVLKDTERMQQDIQHKKDIGADAYVEAWDIVARDGYREILERVTAAY